MNDNKKRVCVDSIFIILGIAICAGMVLTAKWNWTLDGDKVPQTYGIFSLVAQAINNKELPLWNPYIFGGVPDYGVPGTQASYPINWLLCLLFFNRETQVLSYAIVPANLILHFSIYYIGLYLLLRKLNLSSVAAFFIGSLSLNSFSIVLFGEWLVYINGFCWLPLIVLMSVLLFETKGRKCIRYGVMLAVLFGIEALLCISLMIVMIVFFTTILLLIYIYRNKIQAGKYMALKFVASGVGGIILSAPAILSTLVFLRNSSRYVPDFGWVSASERLPLDAFTANTALRSDMESLFSVLPERSWLSVGGIIIFLIAIGIFNKNKQHDLLYFWAVIGGIFSLGYCMGFVFPDVMYYVPFLNNLRETYLYACIFNFFCALMAAYGMQAVERAIKKEESFLEQFRKPVILLLVLGVVAIYNIVPQNYSVQAGFYVGFLISIILLLIIKRKNPLIQYGTILLTFLCLLLNHICFYRLFDAVTFSEGEALTKVEQVNESTKNIVDQMKQVNDGIYRITAIGEPCYPSNSGCALGFYDITGYFNPTSTVSVSLNFNLQKRSQLQNIKYFMVNSNNINEVKAVYGNFFQEEMRVTGEFFSYPEYSKDEMEEIFIYQSPYALGNAWVVSDYVLYVDDQQEEIFARIFAEETDLGKKVFLNESKMSDEELGRVSALEKGVEINYDIETTSYGINSMSYKINSDHDAILVTSEFYYPGWKVYVNGVHQEVLQVDYSNRGVVIPQGISEVKFVYCPNEFIFGIIIQIAALILFIIAVYVYRKFGHKVRNILRKK